MAEGRPWRGPVLALLLHAAAASAAVWTLAAAARRRPAPPPPDPVYPVALALMEVAPVRAPAPPAPPAALAEAEPVAIDPLPAISAPALSEEPSALSAPVPAGVVVVAGAAGAELFIADAAPRRRPEALPGGGAAGIASAPAGAGWAAQPLRQDPPAYPRAARRAGREGTVVLRLAVAGSGAVDEADVAVSSGSPDLDQAACTAARRWRFAPPAAHGLPGAVVRLAVAFRLRS